MLLVTSACALCSCGHYPEPIGSSYNIAWTASDETMIVIDGLPLKDWSRLQKFTLLEHLSIAEDKAAIITDKQCSCENSW